MRWVRAIRFIVTVGAILLAATAITWQTVVLFGNPWLERRVSDALGVDMRWGTVWVTPWADVVFSRMRLAPQGSLLRMTISRVAVRYRWADLVHRRWTRVQSVTLMKPTVTWAGGGTAQEPVHTLPARPPWMPETPIHFAVRDGTLQAFGRMPVLQHVGLDAEWAGQEAVVHAAQAQLLGAIVRATGVLTALATNDPQWQFKIRVSSPGLSGQLEVRDSVKNPSLVGQVEPANAAPIPVASHATMSHDRIEATDIQVGTFQALGGMFDWAHRRWSLTLAASTGGLVTLEGDMAQWQEPRCELTLHDYPVGPLTVSTTVHVAAHWVLQRDGPLLEGTVTTSNSVVNQQSAGEVSGSWTLSGHSLTVHSLAFGDRYEASGTVAFAAPHELTATLEIAGAETADIAKLIEPNKSPLVAGLARGRIDITGTLSNPRLKGYIAGQDGRIGRAPFETATINFEGDGSVIRFLDSRIQQADTMMVMEGYLDLSRLGASNVFEHVKLTSQAALPPWRESEDQEVSHGA